MSNESTESLVLQKETEDVIEEAWEDAAKILNLAANLPKNVKMNGISKMRKSWAENKAWMFPFFGKDLRITVKTEYQKEFSYKDIENTYSELRNMSTNLVSKPDSKYKIFSVDEGELAFLELYNLLRNNFYIEEITQNKILRDLWTLKDIKRKFPSGTKLSRFLGTFIEYEISNSDRLSSIYAGEDLPRTAADFMITLYSQLVSMMKSKKSKLVVSIHPVDFLLCSSHAKWGSCHNVFSGGYRTGGISYMLDGVSAIAYSYEKKTMLEVLDKEMPEKLWRQMIYFDRENNAAVHSREYPGSMPAFSEEARGITAEILQKMTSSERKPLVSSSVPLYLQGSSFHYQDGATGLVHLSNLRELENKELKIGIDSIPCPKCGRERKRASGESPGRILCISCEQEGKPCAGCKNPIEEGDDVVVYQGARYCLSCVQRMFSECENCGEMRPNHTIYLIDGSSYCRECADDLFWWCEGCEEYHSYDSEEPIHAYGDYYCEYSCERLFVQCDYCENYYEIDDTVETEDGETYCYHCSPQNVGQCEECSKTYSTINLTEVSNGHFVCPECLKYYGVCENCEEYVLNEDLTNGLCEDCVPEEHDEDNEERSDPTSSTESHYGIEEDDS
jgi:hypothetical protein